MIDMVTFRRLVVDFFGYAVFLGSSYIMFATNMAFRFLLIPVTFVAFFQTLKNRHEVAFSEGFSTASEFLEDSDIEEDEDQEE